ncbi:hypothetical protein ACROYT_G015266 [Oculina patagonica]
MKMMFLLHQIPVRHQPEGRKLAKGISSDPQKVALLFHTAGTELQELYYTLEATEGKLKPYKDVIEVLDEYSIPKVNVSFERHVFRQMEQQNGEKVYQFVCRLRQKAIMCEFTDVDETIRDQLIEKCQDQSSGGSSWRKLMPSWLIYRALRETTKQLMNS